MGAFKIQLGAKWMADINSWLDRFFAIVTALSAAIGWYITVRLNRGASRSQHTFSAMQKASLDPTHQMHLKAVRPFIYNSDPDHLPDLESSENSDLKDSIAFLLGYYEFVAVALRSGILSEPLIRSDQGYIMMHLFKHATGYIDRRRTATGQPKLYDQFEWLYKRWNAGEVSRWQRALEWLANRPLT